MIYLNVVMSLSGTQQFIDHLSDPSVQSVQIKTSQVIFYSVLAIIWLWTAFVFVATRFRVYRPAMECNTEWRAKIKDLKLKQPNSLCEFNARCESLEIYHNASFAYLCLYDKFGFFMNPLNAFRSEEKLGIPKWRSED